MNGCIARVVALLFALLSLSAPAGTVVWQGGYSDNWLTGSNWSGGLLPGAGDTVVVDASATRTNVLLPTSVTIQSLVVSNATITFTNWSTALTAGSVTIRRGGRLGLPVAFAPPWMSNRVSVACADLTVEAGGAIDADGKGYANDQGPGKGGSTLAGSAFGGGAGHGGRGGDGNAYLGGGAYGSLAAPTTPGSGGGSLQPAVSVNQGGSGGGAVLIACSGPVTVDGTITASGRNSGWASGGGAGGSIHITCGTFGGTTSGLIRADGGSGSTGGGDGGAGGGGRIAIVYAGLAAEHAVRLSAAPGALGWRQSDGDAGWRNSAERGTLYLPDARLLSPVLTDWLFNGVRLYVGVSSWSVDSLTISNCQVVFAADGFRLDVTNGVFIDRSGLLGLGAANGTTAPEVRIGGDLILTNGGRLLVYAGATNLPGTPGAYVGVTGLVAIGTGSWVYPFGHETNGGGALIECGRLAVATNGGINADEKGFRNDMGPGRGAIGTYAGGGGYGGRGGDGHLAGGTSYGTPAAPLLPGSGGGSYTAVERGGNGGGLVRLAVAHEVTLDGTIVARGGAGDNAAGGGAGGGVSISCAVFAGANGSIDARGGDGSSINPSGGGGGGRIAVACTNLDPAVSVSFTVMPGRSDPYTRAADRHAAGIGSIHISDPAILGTDMNRMRGYLSVAGVAGWAPEQLSLNAGFLGFPDGFQLAVTNGVMITGTNAGLALGPGAALSVGGDLVLTNGGQLRVYGAPTSAVPGAAGGWVSVTGTLWLASRSWIYPYADGRNGGAPLFRLGGLAVATNAGFNADGAGFTNDAGPGRSAMVTYAGGAGHGGKGGNGTAGTGGPAYGSSNAPIMPGSGGGSFQQWVPNNRGAHGGGAVRIEVTGEAVVDGTITANGDSSYNAAGGGAGGAIFLAARSLQGGSKALVRADGRDGGGNGGGGGGGRIAVAVGLADADLAALAAGAPVGRLSIYQRHVPFLGALSVTNGAGATNRPPGGAAVGTRLFMATNSLLTVRGSPADYGSPAPRGYGTHPDIAEGTWITNTVASPTDETSLFRRICPGWFAVDGDGGALSNGPGLQAELLFAANTVLTWVWTNQHRLAVSSGAGGSVNGGEVNGWYYEGASVTGILATASGGSSFFRWTGNVPSGQEAVNPLSVAMTQGYALVANFVSDVGQTNVWTGAGAWESVTNWSLGAIPGASDDAVIRTGSVVLSQSVRLAGLTVESGATLVQTNWSTVITADTVIVRSGGRIALPPAFTESQMSNRVYIVCTNGRIDAGGVIDADAGGYAWDQGPGKGGPTAWGGGAANGGRGGDGTGNSGGASVGVATNPSAPGSGGGSYQPTSAASRGGAGGGVVRIEAAERLTIDGTITASAGQTGYASGGGSGGSIFLMCRTFEGGTSGLVRAVGGTGIVANAAAASGGGSGGRIAVRYTDLAEECVTRFRASGGGAGWKTNNWTRSWRHAPESGTLSLPGPDLLGSVLSGNWFRDVRIYMETNAWAPASLMVTNCGLIFAEEGFRLTVSGSLTVIDGYVGVGAPNSGTGVVAGVWVGGDLVLTNAGRLYVYAGATNAVDVDYGALLDVTGSISVSANSWICPFAHNENGGGVLMRMQRLWAGAGAGINADGKGYRHDGGPGRGFAIGAWSGGAGYGGRGGEGSAYDAGPPYGAPSQPLDPGSGGASYQTAAYLRGGCGGGLVRVRAFDSVVLDGLVTAYGDDGDHAAGAGSGGGVWIECTSLGGSNGTIWANGGLGEPAGADGSGGGGGGRIALNYTNVLAGVRLRLAALPGSGFVLPTPGDPRAARLGTIWMPDLSLMGPLCEDRSGVVTISGLTNWSPAQLVVTNCMLGFPDGFSLSVSGGISVAGSAAVLVIGTGSTVSCGGDLALRGGGQLRMYAGPAPVAADRHGGLLSVGGRLSVGATSWIYPYADTNGGSILIRAGRVELDDQGGIRADAAGYPYDVGPGRGTNGTNAGGAGYGGRGGWGAGAGGGIAYGQTNTPLHPGSGGGSYVRTSTAYRGGPGGGVVRIEAESVQMDGTISANGQTARRYSGGGAGGSIFIACNEFGGGPAGSLVARGGDGGDTGGGGAGGRVAIWYRMLPGLRARALAGDWSGVRETNDCPALQGGASAPAGNGYYAPPAARAAEAGTVAYLTTAPPRGVLLMVR